MEKEIKIVTITDDKGINYELQILDEFKHKEKNYAILYDEKNSENEEEEIIYIYEIKINIDGEEEFIEVTDKDLMSELAEIVENMLNEEDNE